MGKAGSYFSFKVIGFYILVALLSMLLSLVSKRGVQFSGNVVRSSISKRKFGFSSSWNQGSKGQGHYTSSAAGSNFESVSMKLAHFEISVAFQPKEREETNIFNKKKGPSPAQLSPTGEDNLFVSKETKDGYVALGVADGVGGWSEAGYDSSAISRELCRCVKDRFETADEHSNLSPKQLLSQAFEDVKNSPSVEIGGTTACLGILTPDLKLKVANLGDSWCGVFRNYKLVNETKFQTHNFNTPFQLAKIPDHVIRQAEVQGRRYIIDSADMADEYTWHLERGDIVMFTTDGVTDNIVSQDIERYLKDSLEDQAAPLTEVAQNFVKEVVKVSKDTKFPSAFAQELSKLTGQRYLGGKEDDITVTLIKVL